MPVHFTAAEMAARKRRLLAAMAGAPARRAAAVRAGERLLAHRLRQFRLLLLPVPLRRRRRPRRAADPLGRPASGAAHLQHRRHPHLEGRRGRRPDARSARDARRSRRARRLGVEFDSYGLTHFNGRGCEAALAGIAELVDASTLVPACARPNRPRNSSTCARRRGFPTSPTAPAIEATRAGADEGEILAAMHHAIFAAGGDYPANEFIIGSGADALLCRYKSGRRKLGGRRSAHARIRRRQPPLPRRDHAHACRRPAEAAARAPITPPRARRWRPAQAELRPGRTAGDVFAAHARVLDAHGLARHRLNACGYSLGAKFTPSWMDAPMFYERNAFVIARGPGLFPAHDPDGQRQRRPRCASAAPISSAFTMPNL